MLYINTLNGMGELKVKNVLFLLMSPFQLVGGMLIGYVGYQIRIEEATYTNPYLLVGVGLVIFGWFFRRMVFKRIVKESNLRGLMLNDLEVKTEEQDKVLTAIREGVMEKVDVVNGEIVVKPSKEITKV